MASNNLPVLRRSKRIRQLVTAAALCMLLQAADAGHGQPAPDSTPAFDAAHNTHQIIRIKRLRPVDPESRELMLASLSSLPAGDSSALS